jgi:hypothetical protein
MRRALGLHGEAPAPRPGSVPSTPGSQGAPSQGSPSQGSASQGSASQGWSHRPPRRFVRDGEIPVTVIRQNQHPEGESGTNQLEAARQTIRSLTTAKERAERSLDEAQATIRDLQTKLAHERMGKDEAIQRAEADRRADQRALQTVQAELVAERDARRKVEGALGQALNDRQEAGDRLRQILADQQTQGPTEAPKANTGNGKTTGDRRKAPTAPQPDAAPTRVEKSHQTAPKAVSKPVPATEAAVGAPPAKQVRRRGRAAKAGEAESEIVEWWKPGWRSRYRQA